MNRNIKKRLIILLLSLVLLATVGVSGISIYVGWSLTHPEREVITMPAMAQGLEIEDVSFRSREGDIELKGWFLPSEGSDRTIVMAHGYKGNRLQTDVPGVEVAKGLVETGFNVLMFDFRNCGESGGDVTSVGQFEKYDLLGAIDYIKLRGDTGQIGIIGYSMGASTTVLAAVEAPEVNAVVLDSPFADLTQYLDDNLAVWSGLPRFPFNKSILMLLPPVLGLNPAEASPVGVIKDVQAEMLFIHGEADSKIPIENSKLLVETAGLAKDSLWVVPGADHVKSYETAPQEYMDKVVTFFEDNL